MEALADGRKTPVPAGEVLGCGDTRADRDAEGRGDCGGACSVFSLAPGACVYLCDQSVVEKGTVQ